MKLNQQQVEIIVMTMISFGACNAEQQILLPWENNHKTDPAAASLNVLAKVFKQPKEIRRAIDIELAKAGNFADKTLVGHAA